jgi:hypothetical protein
VAPACGFVAADLILEGQGVAIGHPEPISPMPAEGRVRNLHIWMTRETWQEKAHGPGTVDR